MMELNMDDKKLIAVLLEALEGLAEDYWETLGDAYDTENFHQYDKAIAAIKAAKNRK